MADITGTTGDDTLTGTVDADTISGLEGNDIIDGLAGADQMDGGAGNDFIYVDNLGDVILEDSGEGFDNVLARASYILTAGAHVEILSTDNHGGTQAINLTGNELSNILIGNAGSNFLHGGGGGADRLAGLGGDDFLFVDADDSVEEAVGGGFDNVLARASFILTAGAYVEILSTDNHGGTQAINLTGNELANIVIGNAGSNVLHGGFGGADTLAGLGGNDFLYVDADDSVEEAVGGGFDNVLARASFILTAGAHVEILSTDNHGGTGAINLTGNALANIVIGNAGSNFLHGGFGGADTLAGLGGNDLLYVDSDDAVDEAAGGGFDNVLARSSYILTAGAHVEILSTDNHGGTAAIDLTGNALANIVIGNAGANVLNGGGGNDQLEGLGGADSFTFTTPLGGGNVDVIVDFGAGDRIVLGGNAGQPFLALASGSLRAGTFATGAALDADDYILYNSGTGALMYDADGSGSGATAVQFATLGTGLSLTVADFLVAGAANTTPVITSGGTASVAENTAAATIVYQILVNDGDGDTITYSLSGTDAALLSIDAATGAVRLNAPADFETKASYTFNVVASDSGSSTSQAVTLTITDVADASTPIINETPGPNDQVATAQFVDRGTFVIAGNTNLPDSSLPSATIVGNLPDSTDRDFFSITLQAGEKLILDVDNSGGNLDAHVRVYNAGGTQIGDNDDPGSLDPGSDPHPTYGHNTDSLFSFRAPSAGTYYFSIESLQDAGNPTFGSYQLHVSIGPPATPAQILAEDVDALISGAEWNHTNLTFGFPTQASQYPTAFDEIDQPGEFQAFSGTQQNVTGQLLQMIAGVSGLTFTQNSASPGQADLRFAMTSDTEAAHAYYPTNDGPGSAGGTAWFNKTDFDSPTQGNYAWMGILHETGHALGLKHGHEAPAVSPDHDSLEYTVMTYRSFPGQALDDEGGYTNEMWGYPQTLMMLDIAALQKIYDGANYAFNSGDSVYRWHPGSGQTLINGVGVYGPGGSNRIFLTIWDGGGNDTYDLSNYTSTFTTGTTLDLRPGEWTTISQTQLANLGLGHMARGNVANALLFEGDTRSLIENAIGSEVNDIIIANQAANRLTGANGADTFRWMASTDLATGSAADTITDFLRGSDRIDLSNIDAIPATGGDDAFTFIGTSAFSNTAGQLRYQVEGGNLRVQADLDGNGIADMEIVVNNNTIFAASDFVL